MFDLLDLRDCTIEAIQGSPADTRWISVRGLARNTGLDIETTRAAIVIRMKKTTSEAS